MDFNNYIKQPFPFEEELSIYFHKSDRLTIFEIGSCEGEDSIRLRRRFPKAEIYTFEPLPKNIEKIKFNFKKYSAKNMKVYQLALSNKDGESTFYVSSGHPNDVLQTDDWDYGNKSSSLLPPKEAKKVTSWLKFDEKITVPTKRLDTFCKENSIRAVDFIFMDVQGAELMVLEGAGAALGRIGMIWMEVETVELYAKQPLKDDVEKFMAENNFKLLKEEFRGEVGDQLYVNKNLPEKPQISRLFGWVRGL